jgi:hypothetical protein
MTGTSSLAHAPIGFKLPSTHLNRLSLRLILPVMHTKLPLHICGTICLRILNSIECFLRHRRHFHNTYCSIGREGNRVLGWSHKPHIGTRDINVKLTSTVLLISETVHLKLSCIIFICLHISCLGLFQRKCSMHF